MRDLKDAGGLWDALQQAAQRALNAVGVLSALLALTIFGVAMAVVGDIAWLLLALMAGLGAVEVVHRQLKTHLIQRRQLSPDPTLLLQIVERNPKWQAQVLKEFQHGGVLFKVVGFDQLQIPLAVTGPLCPRCQAHLTERREARFPFRMRIVFLCSCGLQQVSQYTLGELREEADVLSGAPR